MLIWCTYMDSEMGTVLLLLLHTNKKARIHITYSVFSTLNMKIMLYG